MQESPNPADYYKDTTGKPRARHNTCFLLEPTFLLADILAQDAPLSTEIKQYLERLMQHAKTIQPGDLETQSEEDVRYFAKLALFDKILAKLKLKDDQADGKGWEGGWGEFMTVTWGLI